MSKIRSTLKLISISTGNSDAKKKVSVQCPYYCPESMFLTPESFFSTGSSDATTGYSDGTIFSCRTSQKGPTASSSY